MTRDETDGEGRSTASRDDAGGRDFSFSTSGLEALLERACDGIFVRREDRLVYVNPALLRLLGYADERELVGRSVLTFIHPDHHERLRERIGSTNRGQGSRPPICVRCVRKDGSSVWLDGAGMPARFHGKWAYLVLVRDVTARREEELALRAARETLGARLDVQTKELDRARANVLTEMASRQRAEEHLRRAQKLDAVGQLAGGIAHDFNNLLSIIFAHSSVVARSLDPGHRAQGGMDQILAAAQRAADLTQQLLAVSRRQVLEPRLVDINRVVTQMLSMLERVVGEHIALVRQLEPSLHATRLDPTQLEQVLLNLVVNARDAMPGGGTITITTSNVAVTSDLAESRGLEPGGYVLLVVADTGVGMDSDTLSRIFEPFFTTKALGSGHGLGLSTAHGIVTQSGGALHVETSPGRGAQFFAYFPSEGYQHAESQPRSCEGLEAGNETILLAEDDPGVRRALTEVLMGAGYRVLAAADGLEALRVSREFRGSIDLLVTDAVMPHVTGVELAEKLLASGRRCGVLVVSGHSPQSRLPAWMHFLAKPARPERLLAKVREALRAPPARLDPSPRV